MAQKTSDGRGSGQAQDAQSDQDDQDRKRGQRDLLLALLLLLLGLLCLCAVANLAVRPDQTWQVSADMLSKLDIDVGGKAIQLAPVGEKGLTPLPIEEILTPVGTPSPAPPMVVGKLPTSTPTRAVAVVPTSPATDTPAPVSPPTSTSTPPSTSTPTILPTPTFTPLPVLTFTPIPPTPIPPTSVPPTSEPSTSVPSTSVPPTSAPPTDTPTPSNTPTPTPTPTDTPTFTPTFTPTPTDTPEPTPIPPPNVMSITPNSGYNDADVAVVIGGTDFMDPPTARLGAYDLTVTASTSTTIDAIVPAGLPPGVYALTVTNPDSQSDTLPAAYTVLAPSDPDTTLENAQLLTAGSTLPGHGDDDHVQVIFFEVPESYAGQLWFRIYDADTGGSPGETIDQRWTNPWNTSMRYTLRGGAGAYTGAQAAHPDAGQIASGTPLTQTVIGANSYYHDEWRLIFGPYTADEGEDVGSSRVFKLVVEGMGGDDGNGYQATVSTVFDDNTAPAGSRVFAYCWTFTFNPSGSQPSFYPHIPAGTSTFTQYNLDFDDDDTGSITLHTPLRDITLLPPGDVSTVSGETRNSSHPVSAGEDGATWTAALNISSSYPRNNGSFWTTGDVADLAIFTQPTTNPAP
jgi:hypothetical protein